MPDLSTRVLAHLAEHGPMDVVALARDIGTQPVRAYAALLRLGDQVTREGVEWRAVPGAVVPGEHPPHRITRGRGPWVHLLGTVPDRVIAEQAGVATGTVCSWRKTLGIPPCRKHVGRTGTRTEWYSLLGTMPDGDIARAAGVTKSAVYLARIKTGAPRVSGHAANRAGWVALVESRLGVVADRVLAREVGMSADAVRKERKRRGIPAAPPPKGKGRLAPYVHLLGTMPDSAIATMAGVSPVGVCLLRKRLGVAACHSPRSGPRRKREPRPATLGGRVLAILRAAGGPVPTARLVAEVGDVANAVLVRLRRRGYVVHVGPGMWAVAGRDHAEGR